MTDFASASLSTAWAPAKVNLYLHVGKPNPNGRHPVDSLVQFADTSAADRITVRPARELSLKVTGPNEKSLRNEANNLVLRAAQLLRNAAGRSTLGAAINLHKELPVAAGVGGGSSDAAAALLVLNQYWDIGFTEEGLQTLAGELGADVPACLAGRPTRMRGEGEQLSTVPGQIDLPVVLVNPGVALSTEAVYKRFDKLGLGADFTERPPPEATDGPVVFARSLKRYANDLQAPAISLCAQIGHVLDALEEHHAALVRMSGSGATCFGIFEDNQAAQAAAYAISKRHRKWWVRSTILTGSVSG